MAYLTESKLQNMGFKHLGKNVKISDKASIYNTDQISIGDNSRIDDIRIVSGKISAGKNMYITIFCLLAGGEKRIELEEIAYKNSWLTKQNLQRQDQATNKNSYGQYLLELAAE